MDRKSLFTALSLFAVSATWATDSLKVSVGNTEVTNYSLSEIVKVVPTADSLIFTLSPSGRFATVIAGQKWVFNRTNVFSSGATSSVSFSSSGAVSSSGGLTVLNTVPSKMDWSVQGSLISVTSEIKAHFEILSLNGSVLFKSGEGVKAWSVELGSQAVILKMVSGGVVKSYLVQDVK